MGTRVFLCGLTLAMGCSASASASALAADLKVAPVYKAAPAAASLWNWTGCYIGGNVGGGRSRTTSTSVNKPGTDFGAETETGLIGGGQIGCDYQSGAWVFGIQGQSDIGRLLGSHPIPSFPTFISYNDISWVTTATGRIGYAVQPALLLYARGGAAWTRNDLSVNFTVPRVGLSESAADDRFGWILGAGAEYGFAPNLTAFVEFNYMDFGTQTVAFTPAVAGGLGTPDVLSNRQTIQTVLGGVNYKFNGNLLFGNH
jgi:outer membrane immunogenic protein